MDSGPLGSQKIGAPGREGSMEPRGGVEPLKGEVGTGQRLLAETIGTFLLVLGASGAVVVDALSNGQIGRAAEVTVPGLTVMAVILSMGAISGAHLNPAVTLSFALRGDFPWARVPGYVLAQLSGAVAACGLLFALFGRVDELGATIPGQNVDDMQSLIMELVLSAGLISVIIGTASEGRNVGGLSAVAVGGYVALAGLWSSPITDASMNPARSLGPQIVTGNFHFWWIYVVGPIAGGVVAVSSAYLLRGRGGEAPAKEAAQGSETEGDG
jgi:aquaporin Z